MRRVLIDGTYYGDFAVRGAVELGVELLDIVQGDLPDLRGLLLGRAGISRIALGIWAEVTLQYLGGKLRWLSARLAQRADALLFAAVEILRGV